MWIVVRTSTPAAAGAALRRADDLVVAPVDAELAAMTELVGLVGHLDR